MGTVYRDEDGTCVEVLCLDFDVLRNITFWPAWMHHAAATPRGLPNHVALQDTDGDDLSLLLLNGDAEPTVLHTGDYIVRRPCGTLRAVTSTAFHLTEI